MRPVNNCFISTKAWLGCAALVILAGGASAQTWQEVGTGSGSLPGLFRVSTFDSSVPEGTEVSVRPELPPSLSFTPYLFFNSRQLGAVFPTNSTYAMTFGGGAWTPHPASAKGRIVPDIEALLDSHPAAAASSDQTILAIAGAPYQSFINDAYTAFLAPSGTAWEGRGGSLDEGGISDSAGFSSQVFEVAAALDPVDQALVAYSKGTDTRRGIFMQRFNGTAWAGLAGSDTAPLPNAASTSSAINNKFPSIGLSNQAPVVAWTRIVSIVTETAMLLRYNSGTGQWEGLASSDTTGIGAGRHPKIANLRGRSTFFVAFENRFDRSLKVLEWNGSAFADRGNPLTPWGFAEMAPFDEVLDAKPAVANFDITVDTANRPIVAFRAESPAGSGKYHLFVSYRNSAGTWIAIGDPGSTLGASSLDYTLPGAGTPPYGHYAPSISVGPDNRPILSWEFQNGTPATPTILLRRWSQPTATPPPSLANAVALLLGQISSTPELLEVLGATFDDVVDAADVERLPKP
jgi:hypothetical protein